MMLEFHNKSLQLDLDSIQWKTIHPINLRKISGNITQSQPSFVNMLQVASSILTIFPEHGIKMSVKCFMSCLSFLYGVHHSPYLVLLRAKWDRLEQAVWEGGNNFDESLDLWDSGHLCRLGVDFLFFGRRSSEAETQLKKKLTYIHAGATTKGERVDICTRRSHWYPSRHCQTEHITKHFQSATITSWWTAWPCDQIHVILAIKSTWYNMVQSCSPSWWLWLSATLSWAKAIAGLSPMAWLCLAQTSLAWLGFWLWARPGTSLALM